LPRGQSASNLNTGNVMKYITRGSQLTPSVCRTGNSVF